MARIKMNYRKMKAEDMKKFIEENHKDDKASFVKEAFEMKKPRTYVQKVDVQGNPIYKISKTTGKKYIVREAVELKGEEKRVFNLLKAKKWFYR